MTNNDDLPWQKIDRQECGHKPWNANKTHCKRGHEFTVENTINISRGRRACKKCQYMHNKEYRKRKIAKEALEGE